MVPATGGSRRGFTLAELLVVIALIVILIGIGVGVVLRIASGMPFEGVAARVRHLLMLASASAREHRCETCVHFDVRESRVRMLRRVNLLQFRFDDLADDAETTVGAHRVSAALTNVASAPGLIGTACEFGTDPSCELANSYAVIENVPFSSPAGGIFIDVWIYPGDFRGRRYLEVRKGVVEDAPDFSAPFSERFEKELRFVILMRYGSFFLSLTESYALEVGFWEPKVRRPLRTRDGVVQPNRWQHVSLRYNLREVSLSVDGVELSLFKVTGDTRMVALSRLDAEEYEDLMPKQVPESDEPIFISSPEESFYGAIDEVRVDGYVADEEFVLPPGIRIMGEGGYVNFGPDGALDARYHGEDAEIEITNNVHYRPPEREDESDPFVSRFGLAAPPTLDDLQENEAEPKKVSKGARVATIGVTLSGKSSLIIEGWSDYVRRKGGRQ